MVSRAATFEPVKPPSSPVLRSSKINNDLCFQFQDNSSTACTSSSSGDFLQRASAKRKFDDGANSPNVIEGGNGGGGPLSVDGKGEVKKVNPTEYPFKYT